MKKKKVLVIVGPTASGKTSLSIELAKQLHSSIISGDSIQVFKGFDIGSGKVTEAEKEGIPHSLLDIKDAKDDFSVAEFQTVCREEIEKSEGVAIICGGTGLYLKSCLYDYTFQEETEDTVIEELEKRTTEDLYQELLRVDPKQCEKIHENNRRRIIRSLAIYHRGGIPQSEIIEDQQHELMYDTFIVGCTMEREVLYDRINRRVEMMFEAGLEQEVKNLLAQGVTFKDHAMRGIGYKEWESYFQGESSIEEVKAEIQKHSRQYAKRQYTWFKHQMPVHWFDATNVEERKRIKEEILEWVNT